jgi:glycosyltransferase involved in cell wall biosynthesis
MRILIIHSANSKLIKKISKKYEKENIFIITYSKNRGIFEGVGNELYFDKENNRINAYEVINEVQNIIYEKKIDLLIGTCSNENGENYENIKTLINLVKIEDKVLYNNKLERINYKNRANDYLLECLYSNEKKFIPMISEILCKIKNDTKVEIGNRNKILFIYDRYSVGGVINLIFSWGNKLIDNGNEVLCACYSNGAMLKKFRESRIKEFIYNEGIENSGANFDYFGYIFNLINEEKPNIVIIAGITTILPSIVASVLAMKSKIYLMVNSECHEVFDSKPYGLYLRSYKDIFEKIICVSNNTAESVIKLGADKSKVATIYGTNIEIKGEVVKVKNNKNIITYVGRLSKEKGVEILIKAIGLIKHEILQNCKIKIVGNGEDEEELKQLSEELKIEKYVEFEGYKNDDEVSEILIGTDIFILPSYTEGLPLALIEAMSKKVFCIASDVGGIGEVLRDKDNGFTINSGNYKELAEKIEYALKNKKEVEKMVEKAFINIKERFTLDRCITDLQNLFIKMGE